MRAVTTAVALTATVAALATGCSGGSDEQSARSSKASAAAQVAWSPCDTLTAASVSDLVGERVVEKSGTPDQPRCTFTPETTSDAHGGAAYDVSYLWFDGGLDAALDAMGAVGGQLQRVRLPGADAARIAVKARRSGVLVTGFVQTRGLVQSVNAVQLAPYDEQQVVGATKALLAELAAQAPPPRS